MKYTLVLLTCLVSAVTALGQGTGSTGTSNVATTTVTFKTPQEAVKYYETLIGTLVQRVTAMQDESARMEASVIELQRTVKTLTASNQELSKELATLKLQVAADSEARDAQLKSLADKLLQPVVVPPPPVTTTQQEFVEYIVQPGATLSAISKAYGVSIADIKTANNMKSDALRVGQKLQIPVK